MPYSRACVIGPADVEFVRRLLAEHSGASRYKFSRLLCQEWDWRDPKGQLKDLAARSFLLKLAERGGITLPAKRRESPNRRRRKTVGWVERAREPIVGSLEQLVPLEIRELHGRSEDLTLFECLFQQHHCLSHTSSVGINLKDLVRDRHGRPVSCLLFESAAWQCAARDEFIGWSAAQSQRALQQITGNTRFLVMPWVEVRHLASHVLSRVLRQLRADRHRKYACPLHLVETFDDTSRFVGTCYRAANWIDIGQTTGRTRQDRFNQILVPPNRVMVYPLTPDFRSALQA